MRKERHEIGCYDGLHYQLVYCRMCDYGAWDSKTWRWFLSIEGDFKGDFQTKKEVMEYLTNYKT